MRYRKELAVPPEEIIDWAKRHCKNTPWFRLVHLNNAFPPKGYGIFHALKKDSLYFVIYEKKTFGFSAPRRHLRVKMTYRNRHTLLTGKFYFSDFFSALFLAGLVALGVGIATHFEKLTDILAVAAALIGMWVLQCVLGMIEFRKDEKLLVEKVDEMFTACEALYTRQNDHKRI